MKVDDPRLSRQHLELAVEGGRLFARDLGSSAGTTLGGERIEGRRALVPGDRIRAGSTEIEVLGSAGTVVGGSAAPGEAEPPAGAGAGKAAAEEAGTAAVPAAAFVRTRSPSVLTGDLERDGRNIALLLETIADLHAAEDQEDLLRRIVDRAIALAGGARGALLLKGAETGVLEGAVARDARRRDLEPGEVLARSLPARALESGRAVVLTDTSVPEQRDAATASVLQGALGAVLAVPIRVKAGPIGVLYVDSQRPASGFGPAELAVFEALAAQSAVAIERARLVSAAKGREVEARRRLEAENARLRVRLGAADPLGESPAMERALALARRVASSELTVLVTGETGSGKEVVARFIHGLSPRRDRPFVVVDCGAIPETLVESELFGHEKGAFTGASEPRAGRFREAHGGTVLLDEVGELPLALQPKLLRVLQERTISSVGGRGAIQVDVRVLAATNRDLAAMVREGTFRQDLFYRLSGMTIPVPPLRERGEDTLLLARAFLVRFAAATGRPIAGFTREAQDAIAVHPWPGNVRELEHAIHRAVVLAEPPYVTVRDLGFAPVPRSDGDEADTGAIAIAVPSEARLPFPKLTDARERVTERFERAYLVAALERAGGNVSRAAELAGVSRQFLHRLIRRHGIANP